MPTLLMQFSAYLRVCYCYVLLLNGHKKAVNLYCSDGGSGKTLTATRKLTVS